MRSELGMEQIGGAEESRIRKLLSISGTESVATRARHHTDSVVRRYLRAVAERASGSDWTNGSSPVSTATLVLASGSPRRIAMLRDAGFEIEVEPADLDDSALVLGDVEAREVAPALAHFKARRVAARRAARGAPPAWILAADTVCERDGVVLGKPRDDQDARTMIKSLTGRGHGVVTGWCLMGPDGVCRVGRDMAWIVLGEIPDDEFERFIELGAWKGKAGGYNLPEVIARGWPVRCEGDPETVVGLPLRRLEPMLREVLRDQPSDAAHPRVSRASERSA